MEKVIVYVGKKPHAIGAEYFFQHPVVEVINRATIAPTYTSTFIHMIKEKNPKRKIQLRRGLSILEMMMEDLLGTKGRYKTRFLKETFNEKDINSSWDIMWSIFSSANRN
jgi:hypothetical protein